MRIRGLVWLEYIVEKLLWKHHVRQAEVREVLAGSARFFFVEKGHRPAEDVYAALGQTEAGRYLAVFFVYTQRPPSPHIVSPRYDGFREKEV